MIIDSSADISCIPETFQLCGRATQPRPLEVQDAQGGAMQSDCDAQIRRVENETRDLIHDNPGEDGANDQSEEDVSEGELHAELVEPSQQGRDANSQQQVRDANSQQQVRFAHSQQVRDANSQQVRDARSQQVRDADSQLVEMPTANRFMMPTATDRKTAAGEVVCAAGEVREVCATGEVREMRSVRCVQVRSELSTGALHVASSQVRLEAKAPDAITRVARQLDGHWDDLSWLALPKPDSFRPSTREEEEFAQWPQWSWTFGILPGSQLQQ